MNREHSGTPPVETLRDALADAETTLLRHVAERRQVEQVLQAERSFVDAVLDTVGALVAVTDREGRIVRFNRACEHPLGYSFARGAWASLLGSLADQRRSGAGQDGLRSCRRRAVAVGV